MCDVVRSSQAHPCEVPFVSKGMQGVQSGALVQDLAHEQCTGVEGGGG
jgi:hypothetical protein